MADHTTKTCTHCKQAKPLNEFSRDRTKPEGYSCYCRACINEKHRAQYRESEAYRARKRDNLRRRYQENPEHRAKQKAWSMAALHRRRARREANGGSYTVKEWRALCATYLHRCACCGAKLPLTPDHIVPIVKGGTNDIANIQPLCLPCNLRKARRVIDYRDGRSYTQRSLGFEDDPNPNER